MDREILKAVQRPLKERYRADPAAAAITLHASGKVSDGIACSVETGRELVKAGLHRSTGGPIGAVCSGDMLLQALVACAGVTLKAVSTALAIPLKSGTVSAEGDLDFRGTLGVDKEAPVGFREIRLTFDVDTDVPQDKLAAHDQFVPDQPTYPNGTHLAEVEIDPATGQTRIVNYIIVDDFGVTLNPLLLAGQVHGGAVQGIGQALMEQAVYDEGSGQLLTASLMDYALPKAGDMPSFAFETANVPCTSNPLGVKGAGEAGAIGSCPAVMNAIVDALWRAYRVRHIDMPATPERVWKAIEEGQQLHRM